MDIIFEKTTVFLPCAKIRSGITIAEPSQQLSLIDICDCTSMGMTTGRNFCISDLLSTETITIVSKHSIKILRDTSGESRDDSFSKNFQSCIEFTIDRLVLRNDLIIDS